MEALVGMLTGAPALRQSGSALGAISQLCGERGLWAVQIT